MQTAPVYTVNVPLHCSDMGLFIIVMEPRWVSIAPYFQRLLLCGSLMCFRSFSWEYFRGALASSVYYLTTTVQLSIHRKTFAVRLKTTKTVKGQPSQSFFIYGSYSLGSYIAYYIVDVINEVSVCCFDKILVIC